AAPDAAAKTCLESLHSPHRVATEVQIPLQQSLSQVALGSPPKPPIVRCAKRARAGGPNEGLTRPVIAVQINAGSSQRSVLRIACEPHASSIAATTSAAAARPRLSGLRLM